MLINPYYSSTQLFVEAKLNQILQEFRSGKRESSMMTTITQESLSGNEKEAWRSIRKELEDIGLTVAAFELNKGLIMAWFRNAIATGAFEEICPSDEVTSDCSDTVHTYKVVNEAVQEEEVLGDIDGLANLSLHLDLPEASEQPINMRTGYTIRSEVLERATVKHHSTDNSQSQLPRLPSPYPGTSHVNSAIIIAVKKGDTSAIERLLYKGANINHRPSLTERSTLEWAIVVDDLKDNQVSVATRC